METHDYRLERWLAIILSLLFLLPFVARADEIAYTGSYHGDEMPYTDGEKFLALRDGVLVPVKIGVAAEQDMLLDEYGETTGKLVSVIGFEDALLVRGANLHPGKVSFAAPSSAELDSLARKATFHLGDREYDLSYRCGAADCTLMLTSGELAQDLVTIEIDRVGEDLQTLDVVHFIEFAGDLDHDGRLDLVAHLARHWNEARPTLWLSSAAKEGQLVAMTAELSTSGC